MSNKRYGGGPRSAAGKANASRNALRHGFSAKIYRPSPAPERIERLAQAIAGDDSDAAVGAAAFKIAENELLLAEIAAHKAWVVERLREPYANSFASKDNGAELMLARAMQMWLAEREIEARLPKLLEKYALRMLVEEFNGRDFTPRADATEADKSAGGLFPEEWRQEALRVYDRLKACGWRSENDSLIPLRLMVLLEEPDQSLANEAAGNTFEDRDAFEALEAAIRDLVRLDRYEQRAWSRQKRAILELANIKLARRFSGATVSSPGCGKGRTLFGFRGSGPVDDLQLSPTLPLDRPD